MAILQLRSNNPDFSYVIKKNPGSGMTIKSMRKGKAFAWYSDDSTYNIYFKDADNEISYQKDKNEQFEYMNVTRYNTPLFSLNAITDFFSSTFKSQHENDVMGFENTLLVNMVYVEAERYLDFFNRHFDDFSIERKELANKNFRLEISTEKSIYELLNFANTLFIFLSLLSKDYLSVNDATIEKYIKSLNVIKAPYFIRYLFSRNMLSGRKSFNRFKPSLEAVDGMEIVLEYGDTATQRKDWISKQLNFDRKIIDIGCGEGAYAIPFSSKISGRNYHAIDIDEEIRERLSRKLQLKEIENVILYESLAHYLETHDGDERADVLLTEVIEHMSESQAEKLLKSIFRNIDFNSLIVTTPNADFNNFYALEGFRHFDHKWEMNKVEFHNWMNQVLEGEQYSWSWHGIGDCVNGIYTSQGVIITRKEE